MESKTEIKDQPVDDLSELCGQAAESETWEAERQCGEETLLKSGKELKLGNETTDILLNSPDQEMYRKVLSTVLEALESDHGVFGWKEGSALELGEVIADGIAPILHARLQRDTQGQKNGCIEEEHLRLRTIVEQITDAVAITDINGVIRYINPAFSRLLAHSAQEIVGRPFPMFLEHSHRYLWKSEWTGIGRSERRSHHVSFKRKDGADRIVDLTVLPLRNPSGRVTDYGIVCRDVTRETDMEKRLRQIQKMEALGTLIGGITHDFNNILGVIFGCTQMAQLDIPQDTPAHRHLTQVVRACHRATELVRQILAFSRQSEQGRKPVQLSPLIKEALKMLRASLPATIEIRQRIESESGLMWADPTQIHQALINLCTHAVHVMRQKRGILEVNMTRADSGSSHAAESAPDMPPGSYLLLTVSGTSCDTDGSDVEPSFSSCFQTGQEEGIGLAVVRGIVRSHDGFIRVSSEPGKSSTFEVFFPRTELPKKEITTDLPASLPGGSERILFVDDEEALARVGQKMLERMGYEVVSLTNSIEALKVFQDRPERFDLVVTDQTMPNITGVELAGEIMRIRSDMPVILCTGFSETITEEQVKAMGIREFLTKPLAIRDLATTIRNVLDRQSAKGRT